MYSEDLVVAVDGVAWSRLDLLKYESTNTYEILFTDDPPKLRFGDGIVGNVPTDAAEIAVNFVYGKGLQGAIGANQITGPVAPLVINGVTINMTLTNDAAAIGGDPEDIRYVKAFASAFFRTQNAAVIKTDYDTIAQLEPGVAIADAQIMRGIDNEITIQGFFSQLSGNADAMLELMTLVSQSGVSGIGGLGVGGTSGLYACNTEVLGVSGIGSVS